MSCFLRRDAFEVVGGELTIAGAGSQRRRGLPRSIQVNKRPAARRGLPSRHSAIARTDLGGVNSPTARGALAAELAVRRCSGAAVQPCSGAAVQPCSGAAVQRCGSCRESKRTMVRPW
jgi:hypothetical protein